MAFAQLKARHSVVWGNGPYERITNTIRDIHALVIERIDPKPGERVLDAATGTGAVAILAAERGADVVGQDIAPVLIETARQRAAEEGVDVQFDVGDAEQMS
jgi:ubiquinone/menaquinone biosynthesis C-methylase UbiE